MNKLPSASFYCCYKVNSPVQSRPVATAMYVDDHERRQIVMEKINFMTANKWQLYTISVPL